MSVTFSVIAALKTAIVGRECERHLLRFNCRSAFQIPPDGSFFSSATGILTKSLRSSQSILLAQTATDRPPTPSIGKRRSDTYSRMTLRLQSR